MVIQTLPTAKKSLFHFATKTETSHVSGCSREHIAPYSDILNMANHKFWI